MKYTNLTAGDKEILLSLADSKGRVAIRSRDGLVYMDGFMGMNQRMGDAIRAAIPGGLAPEEVDAHLTINGGRLAMAATVGGVVGLYDI